MVHSANTYIKTLLVLALYAPIDIYVLLRTYTFNLFHSSP